MTHGGDPWARPRPSATQSLPRAGIGLRRRVEDVIMGCANPEGATGGKHRSPESRCAPGPARSRTRPGITVEPLLFVGPAIDRQSHRSASSRGEGRHLTRAGGVESISLRTERDEQAHGPGKIG